ncbi:MAG: hypothetical protein ACKOOD_02795 [Microbacteriaceae bacterium]
MSVVRAIKSGVGHLLANYVGRVLQSKNEVQRAPRYGLIQVELSQVTGFKSQIGQIAAQFDEVLVLWPNQELPPRPPSNVQFFAAGGRLTSRWQLVSKCEDGFIFPISLVKPIQKDHADHLLKHLFHMGGASAVGLMNLEGLTGESYEPTEAANRLVLAPTLDLDYTVIDQRFWKLDARAITGNESESFVAQASARGFGLFVCDHALSSPFRRSRIEPARIEQVLEQFIRYPQTIKALDLRAAHQCREMFGLAEALASEESQLLRAELNREFKRLLSKSHSDDSESSAIIEKLGISRSQEVLA